MKRYSVVRILNNSLSSGDIGIFVGEGICKEAYTHHRVGNFYFDDDNNIISMVTGMAMCTNKRIFLFCDDEYFLKSMSDMLHVAASGCLNLCIIILVSGMYNTLGNNPTIYSSIKAPKNMLFHMGLNIHNYTRHFSNSKNPSKEIKLIWEKIRGPISVIIDVDRGSHKSISTEKPVTDVMALNKFILDSNINTINYEPPVDISSIIGDKE